jgi:hypothetical protein
MESQEVASLSDKFLTDCSPDKAFWTTKGLIIRNMHELLSAIENMDDYTFRYHVNLDNNKNDFADWIRAVFGDEKLADQLEGVMKKEKYVDILRKGIKQYETENTSINIKLLQQLQQHL